MAYTTALYLRLSLDDGNQGESDSIQNQRDLLRGFVAANPELSAGEVLEFADDGRSGTSFDRPQVKALLALARQGKIQCIVVKDLSRWGRNYIEVSEYLEQIFPFLGIRFISVNDHYDSSDCLGATAPIDIAFSSIIHDVYSKELSMKVRQGYEARANKGEYVCGRPPFGYLRSEKKKNQLVIDEGAAEIVRRIFDMAAGGLSCVKIAAALNEEGLDTAISWYHRNGRSTMGVQVDEHGRTYWDNTQIRRIIQEELYTGTLVCFKYRRAELGKRRQVRVPKDEWLRIPNTHEAIVTTERFAAANARLRCNQKRSARGIDPKRSPFTGKLQCGHCGRAMKFQNCKQPYQYCSGVKLKKGKGCFDGKVYLDSISEAVLSAVKIEAAKALDERQTRKTAGAQASIGHAAMRSELRKHAAQIKLSERGGIALYEDFADGRLDREQYLTAKSACARELANAEKRSAELNASLADIGAEAQPIDDTPLLRRVLKAESVTDEVLSLVERVIVYDAEHIEIRFAFNDTNVGNG